MGSSWTDYYQARGAGISAPDQSIVTGGGAGPGSAPTAGGAPFAWVGLMMLLTALYIMVRLGAKLSTPQT